MISRSTLISAAFGVAFTLGVIGVSVHSTARITKAMAQARYAERNQTQAFVGPPAPPSWKQPEEQLRPGQPGQLLNIYGVPSMRTFFFGLPF